MKSFFTLLLGLVAINSSFAAPVEVAPYIEREYLGTWQRNALNQEVAALTIAEDRYGAFIQVWVSQFNVASGTQVIQELGRAYLQRKKSEGDIPYYEAAFPKVIIRLVMAEFKGVMAVRVFNHMGIVPYGDDDVPNQNITLVPGTYTFEQSQRAEAYPYTSRMNYNASYAAPTARYAPSPNTFREVAPRSVAPRQGFSMPTPGTSQPSSLDNLSPGYSEFIPDNGQTYIPRQSTYPGERTYTPPVAYSNRRQGTLEFINTTDYTVEIAKLDNVSNTRTFQRLYPGQSYRQATYEEDAWIITRVHDQRQIAVVNGTSSSQAVDIGLEATPYDFVNSGLETQELVPVPQLLSVVLKVANFSQYDVMLYTKDDVNQEMMVKLIRPEDVYAIDSSVGQEWILKDAVTRTHLKTYIANSNKDQVLRYD